MRLRLQQLETRPLHIIAGDALQEEPRLRLGDEVGVLRRRASAAHSGFQEVDPIAADLLARERHHDCSAEHSGPSPFEAAGCLA